ncbi:MAG TPA: radical SAM protein [Nitrospinota bacterium]|nr:radical SAM protein [Nitrospinota bacterium]
MKSSRFNVEIPLEENKEETLIFNTFTDSRVVINKELKAAMGKADKKRPLTEEETGYLSQLKDLGIMVNDTVDEDKELEYWFQKFKFDSSILSITLLATYDCNMKCTYCFEEGVIKKEYMSEGTSRLVIEWLSRKLKVVRPATLRLLFYGGDPMVTKRSREMMLFIAKSLHKITSQKDIELDLMMVTNGIVLPENYIKEMVQYGLKGIKVTLDGDETAHNRTRIFKNNKGTFKTIIKNLKKIKGMVPITIGCNYDEVNKKSVPALLDLLKEAGFEDSVEAINFKPIFQNIENAGKAQFDVCTYSDMDVKDIAKFKQETKSKGFQTREGISLGPCEATRENSYTIDPGGKIYKCGGFVGREKFKIGDLHEGLNEENTRFMTVDLWRSKDCEGCKYLPLCGGGCRTSAYVKHQDFKRFACELKYFNTVLPELLKEELAQ